MAELKVIEKKCRVKKTSKEQYEIYCSFLEQHVEIRFKKDADQSIQPLWDQLTMLLNSTNSGPSKRKKSWQKTFENWRNSIRHKKRQEEAHRQATGGGPEKPSELKDLELRALAVWGKVALDGVSENNTEVGFGPPPTDDPEETFITDCMQIIAAEDRQVTDVIVETIATSIAAQPDDETAVPTNIPTASGSNANKRRKLQASRDVQLEKLVESDKENTEALREIGNQFRRFVDIKEAELVESRNRTNALNNIADAIRMSANRNN